MLSVSISLSKEPCENIDFVFDIPLDVDLYLIITITFAWFFKKVVCVKIK
jgi:hypothetical protein